MAGTRGLVSDFGAGTHGKDRTGCTEKLTVFAAASMKDAIERAAGEYQAAGGDEVVVSFASSSVLARQIEAGAPADVYISANTDWMAYLVERDLVRADSETIIAGNNLVIAAAEGTDPVDSPDALLDQRFAMGDPSHVPAGKYARTALENLGLWKDVEKNAVFGENVRVALELASRGEVKAAIVYGSDQKAASIVSAMKIYTTLKKISTKTVYYEKSWSILKSANQIF